MSQLSEEDCAILDLEENWRASYASKSDAVRDVFGWTMTRYHIRLAALLDDPAAIYARPVTVGRLRRLRDRRENERGASTRGHDRPSSARLKG
ncbi:MAG: DUF3263 domain-containing protein [Flaviflexus sp.]|nr:DUF3263 domain-containing protein [Flaviflexus sp.]